jgi:sulfite reductase beta subunit-like hemoprotein
MPHALARLLGRYREERGDDERFHQWARRVSNEELRAMVRDGGPREAG